MKTTYKVKFQLSVSIDSGAPDAQPRKAEVSGSLDREEEDELSAAEFVRLEGFRALAPVIPSEGSQDYKGVMDAVTEAASAIAGALKESGSASSSSAN
jgi:hypothetical protein